MKRCGITLRIAVLTIAVLLLCDCKGVPPRTESTPCVGDPRNECARHWEEVRDDYDLSYVEVTQSGLLADRGQLDAAVESVRSLNRKGHTIVVVFVHGWFHSDKASDRDVERARNMLIFLKSHDSTWNVKGVYVGWQAYTWLPDPLGYLTMLSKKHAAERTGQLALTELILRIEGATREIPGNKLLVIGHSFGGLAVLEATSPIMMERLIQAQEDYKQGKAHPVQGVGDLVVLLNPAVEASRYVPLFNAANAAAAATIVQGGGNALSGIFAKNDRPIFLSLSSQTDSAVGDFFPAGSLFLVHGHSDVGIVSPPHPDRPLRPISEATLTTHAVGKVDEITTHQVDADGSVDKSDAHFYQYSSFDPPRDDLLPRGWLRCSVHWWTQHSAGSPSGMQYDCLTLPYSFTDIRQKKDRESSFNPYWNVTVNDNVMHEHSDFMNQSLARFIWQLVFSPPSLNDGDVENCVRYKNEPSTQKMCAAN